MFGFNDKLNEKFWSLGELEKLHGWTYNNAKIISWGFLFVWKGKFNLLCLLIVFCFVNTPNIALQFGAFTYWLLIRWGPCHVSKCSCIFVFVIFFISL